MKTATLRSKRTSPRQERSNEPDSEIANAVRSTVPHTLLTKKLHATLMRSMQVTAQIITGSPTDAIERARKGIPAQSFVDISEMLGISRTKLFDVVGLPKSTIEQRIKDEKNLTTAESNTAWRIAKVFQRANDVFESDESAKYWMLREIRSLGGVTPISLLDTDPGYELVMDTLGKIEHGIPS